MIIIMSDFTEFTATLLLIYIFEISYDIWSSISLTVSNIYIIRLQDMYYMKLCN